MGMTVNEIEFALNSIKIVLDHTEKGYYPEQFKTHEECLKEVMDIVRKYQEIEQIYNKYYCTMTSMARITQVIKRDEKDGNDK